MRSQRYGVGKVIGGAVYLHRQYEELLGHPLEGAKQHLPLGFDYVVVKYHIGRGTVSFLCSPDFDSAPEPIVGDSCLVYLDGKVRQYRQLADPYIYHHKWLFVTNDYSGFDVAVSKRRSLKWLGLTPPVDFTRIGRKSYWETFVLPRLL